MSAELPRSQAEDEVPPKAEDSAEGSQESAGTPRLTFLTVLVSTFGAALGVQNRNARKRDFESGQWWPFVVAGILFTALFVGTLLLVVQLVLP